MNNHEQIKLYLEKVGAYLPFTGEAKYQLLDELKPDLEEALTINKDLEQSFGDPQSTAKNILQNTQFEYEYASWMRRLIAFTIDTTIVWGFLMLFFGIPLFLADRKWNLDKSIENMTGQEIIVLTILIIYAIIIFIVGFSYYIIPERLYGQTMGKKLLGIHVMDISGIRIGWKQAVVRNIAKYNFEFLPLEFLLGWLIKDKDTSIQKATDVLAQTRVVKYTRNL